ncbi:hypothetical protein KR767_00900 [Luteibacter anthropi]|uniref:TrbI/VirB10 family protein n=1 Tax=Luteibacter anthropi TaxID=564369 RepID=UPI002032FBF8|nr:TrbI/VirB10 family protein [Luteibacter anthropi]URX62671.1 hypothetical protein KR767_00900 [Luteibacter anthropi]
MSPNNPYHPDDDSARENVTNNEQAQQHDPLSGNPYSNQQQRQAQPDLDAAAPQLAAADVRRMNRRALAFLGGIVMLLLFVGYFLATGGRSGKQEAAPKPKEETVTVPQAPKPLALPTPQPAEPIALVPPPPLPTAEQTRPARMDLPARPAGPTLLERRIMAAEGGAAQAAGGMNGAPPGPQGPYGFPGLGGPQQPPPQSYNGVPINSAYAKSDEDEKPTSAEPLTHPDTLMLRGTFIRCVLETRIITDIPGFTSCIVTEPIYSFTGKRLLLPKGSKVLGKYEMEPNGPRVAVIWDRIVTPTGIDVKMSSPGIDSLGGAGHPGIYNAHWGSRIGSALLISMFSDAFKYEAAKHGPRQTTIAANGTVLDNPYESNTAQTLQMLANSAVVRAANRPATVTINQGTVLAIYVAKDVDFAGVVARY